MKTWCFQQGGNWHFKNNLEAPLEAIVIYLLFLSINLQQSNYSETVAPRYIGRWLQNERDELRAFLSSAAILGDNRLSSWLPFTPRRTGLLAPFTKNLRNTKSAKNDS